MLNPTCMANLVKQALKKISLINMLINCRAAGLGGGTPTSDGGGRVYFARLTELTGLDRRFDNDVDILHCDKFIVCNHYRSVAWKRTS